MADPFSQQTREGPGSANWDTVAVLYDGAGRVEYASSPYVSTAGQFGTVGPTTAYTYDARGRPLQVTDPAGGTSSYSYSLNDTEITVGPAPTGEHSKSRQFEYDALGRMTSVCEMTSASGSGTCSQNTSQSGFWTTYQYDPLGDLLKVSQNQQSGSAIQYRTFTYDGLSRMTSENHPETSSSGSGGTTFYTYDAVSDGKCAVTSSGDKVERLDPANNYTCYAWDALHRLTSVTYPAGPNTVNMPGKYYVYDSAPYWGISLNNGAGRLTEAYTYLGGNTYTASAFSYDVRGEVTDYYEYTPHGSWYRQQQGYFANGLAATPQGFIGTGTTTPYSDLFGHSLDGEGRMYGIWDATRSNTVIWSGTSYNTASQATQVSVIAGAENFTYDPNSGRMTQWSSTAGSNTQAGTLTWNANGTLQDMQINDTADSSNMQNCTYGYDDVERLLNANCGSIWSQTFGYDAFGNIAKTGTSSFHPGYTSGNHVIGFTYDGMGNVTNDGANTYTYDAEGRPLTVGGVQTTYDALGRAVEQNRSGTYTQILYSPVGQKFGLMNGSTVKQYFVPLAGGVQAVYNSSGLQYYGHSDWLGSSRFAATTSGAVYYDGAYAPFGENYAETGTTDRSFTGQTQDTTAGLYDFLLRQQSSAQGRWLVPDPAALAAVDLTNPQTWNRYAYVANNPLSNVDPLGLYVACDYNGDSSCDDGGGAGGGGGGGGGGGQISGGPCGAYCAPLPGLISQVGTLAANLAATNAWSPYTVQASGYTTNGTQYQINDQGQWYNTSSGDELSESDVQELGLPSSNLFFWPAALPC